MHHDIDPSSLADLATAVWRLRNKLADDPHYRHVKAVADALSALGVEVRDYDGAPFDSGMEVRVLAIQPSEDVDREVVIETVRPAVYVSDSLIQPGEVIVGTPASDTQEVQKGTTS